MLWTPTTVVIEEMKRGADPLCGPAEAAPVPVLRCPKQLLQEFEHCVWPQPPLIHFKVLLEVSALHSKQSPLQHIGHLT